MKGLVALLLVGGVMFLGGCSDTSSPGELPPPPKKEYTEEELSKMPPEARARVESAQKMAEGNAKANAPQGK
jgi:hypothetical protein